MTVSQPLIFFFTDFGESGPYLGQMEAAILSETLQARVVHLCSDAPAFDPRHSAYLLAALADQLPRGAILVCVVDPGVGSDRKGLLVEAGSFSFVGPDNGLLGPIISRYPEAEVSELVYQEDSLSVSFHGRDLFAPVAANLAKGQPVEVSAIGRNEVVGVDWPADLGEVIYIDHYGNIYSGMRGAEWPLERVLAIGEHKIKHARTFSAVPKGEAFWYVNSCGLIEVAVSGTRADRSLAVKIGDNISFLDTGGR